MSRKNKDKTVHNRVGLDIGSHTINGVEVEDHGSELVIKSAGAVPILTNRSKQDASDHGAVVQALKSLWATSRFSSRQVVLALPPDAVYIKWLHLESDNEEHLDQTARAAAARGAPFPAHEAIIDYRVLSSRGALARNVHFLMLVAASSTVVDKLLNTCAAAGIEPLAVDIGTAACLRSFEMQKRAAGPLWSGQPLAHCIIGARSTTIAVVRSGGMEFARSVPVGGNDFTECIAEHAQVDWAEAEKIKLSHGARLIDGSVLIAPYNGGELRVPCEHIVGRLGREIQRSLRFFSSQFAEGSYLGMIGAATLSGGGALLKGIDTALAQTGIEITGTINPFAGFSVAAEGGIHNIGDSAAQYTAAVGLAIGDYWASSN